LHGRLSHQKIDFHCFSLGLCHVTSPYRLPSSFVILFDPAFLFLRPFLHPLFTPTLFFSALRTFHVYFLPFKFLPLHGFGRRAPLGYISLCSLAHRSFGRPSASLRTFLLQFGLFVFLSPQMVLSPQDPDDGAAFLCSPCCFFSESIAAVLGSLWPHGDVCRLSRVFRCRVNFP